MVSSDLYVNQIRISYNSKSSGEKLLTVDYPDIQFIEQAVEDMEKGYIGSIELNNTDEYVNMTIFGEPGLYQIGIIDENENVYYYCNGKEPTDEVIDIAWNTFPQHLVCSEYNLLSEIVEQFCKSGEKHNDVEWIFEEA